MIRGKKGRSHHREEGQVMKNLRCNAMRGSSPMRERKGKVWSCDATPPKLGTVCRLECKGDKILQKESIRVCTPIGWAPSPQTRGPPPACVINPCPNLKDKQINHGEWVCTPHNSSKTCSNHRIGEICHMKCKDDTKPHLEHLTVCTENGLTLFLTLRKI